MVLIYSEISDRMGKYLTVLVKVVTIMFIVFPLGILVIMSFDARAYVGYFPPTHGLSLEWYKAFISSPRLTRTFVNSLVLAISSSTLGTALAMPVSIMMARRQFKGKSFLMTIFLSPLMLPAIAVGVALSSFFGIMHVYDAWTRLLMAHMIIVFPYVMRTNIATLRGFDITLEQAAMSLGASPFQAFRKVTFPIIRPGSIAGILFAFAISFDEIPVSILLTSPTVRLFSIELMSAMRQSYTPMVLSVCVVLILIAICITIVVDRIMGLDKFIGFWR